MGKIKPVFKCLEEYKALFKRSQCLLTISVGQEVHEEEKFAATVELVDNSFESCIVLIDDTLQRHTMALHSNENADAYYDISLQAGDAWIARNKKYLEQLTIAKSIIRWNQWLFHKDYPSCRNQILDAIESDKIYKEAFNSTISEFLRRYFHRLIEKENFDLERAHYLCLDYLIEECTALYLWPELECQFEVYPSPRNQAMSATHKKFVLPRYPNLLNSVAIKFKNRKQFKEQKLFPQNVLVDILEDS